MGGRDAEVCHSTLTGSIMASLRSRAILDGPAVAKILIRRCEDSFISSSCMPRLKATLFNNSWYALLSSWAATCSLLTLPHQGKRKRRPALAVNALPPFFDPWGPIELALDVQYQAWYQSQEWVLPGGSVLHAFPRPPNRSDWNTIWKWEGKPHGFQKGHYTGIDSH